MVERLHGKEKVESSILSRGSLAGLVPVSVRRGSSVGQSARLIIVRSRVQTPLPLLELRGNRSEQTIGGYDGIEIFGYSPKDYPCVRGLQGA